ERRDRCEEEVDPGRRGRPGDVHARRCVEVVRDERIRPGCESMLPPTEAPDVDPGIAPAADGVATGMRKQPPAEEPDRGYEEEGERNQVRPRSPSHVADASASIRWSPGAPSTVNISARGGPRARRARPRARRAPRRHAAG